MAHYTLYPLLQRHLLKSASNLLAWISIVDYSVFAQNAITIESTFIYNFRTENGDLYTSRDTMRRQNLVSVKVNLSLLLGKVISEIFLISIR